MNPALAWAVFAGLGLGFGLWSLASLLPRMNRPRLYRRVAPYVLDISEAARADAQPTSPGPLFVFGALAHPVLSGAARRLGSLLGGAETVERRLRQSGSRLTVDAFRFQQVLSGLVGALLGIAGVVAAAQAQSSPVVAQALMVVVAAIIGVVARDYLLQRAARRRVARLAAELPVVLEFLTLSLSAGEGILDAIRRVSRVSVGELSQELAGVVTAVNTGLPFAETLAALSDALDLPPFTRCVEQIVGALDRGTPLVEVLRAQAQDARDDAKRDLLEMAGRKEVAMLFPLVFFILPITIAFAIWPGLLVLQLGF